MLKTSEVLDGDREPQLAEGGAWCEGRGTFDGACKASSAKPWGTIDGVPELEPRQPRGQGTFTNSAGAMTADE